MSEDYGYVNRVLRETTPSDGVRFDKVWNVIDRFPAIRDGNVHDAPATVVRACAKQLRETLKR